MLVVQNEATRIFQIVKNLSYQNFLSKNFWRQITGQFTNSCFCKLILKMIHFGKLYMYKYQEMRIRVFDFPFWGGGK